MSTKRSPHRGTVQYLRAMFGTPRCQVDRRMPAGQVSPIDLASIGTEVDTFLPAGPDSANSPLKVRVELRSGDHLHHQPVLGPVADGERHHTGFRSASSAEPRAET